MATRVRAHTASAERSRTGGTIGSLSHLIRAAAISAILDGSEQITKALLDAIRVDHAAESSTRRASSRVS